MQVRERTAVFVGVAMVLLIVYFSRSVLSPADSAPVRRGGRASNRSRGRGTLGATESMFEIGPKVATRVPHRVPQCAKNVSSPFYRENNGVAACDTTPIVEFDEIPVAEAMSLLGDHCAPRPSEPRELLACPSVFRDFQLLKGGVHTTFNRRSRGKWRTVLASDSFDSMTARGTADFEEPSVRPFATSSSDADANSIERPFSWWNALPSNPVPVSKLDDRGRIPRPLQLLDAQLAVDHYDAVVILPTLTSCMGNLYHSTFEYVLPLFEALRAIKTTNRSVEKIAVMVRLEPLITWGVHNSRCPLLNMAHSGFGEPAASWFMLHAVRQAFRRLDFIMVNEQWRHGRAETDTQQLFNGTIVADVAYRGLPARCFTVARSLEAGTGGDVEEYPTLRTDPTCSATLRSFRRHVLKAHGIPDPGPVTEAEARCPHVAFVSRKGRLNGRDIRDQSVLMAALVSTVDAFSFGCGHLTIIKLEELSPEDQLRFLQNVTVLVGARGAGLVMATFLRPGAGLVPISPWRAKFPLLFEDATVPWVPWGFLVDSMHVAHARCRLFHDESLDSSDLSYSMCRYMSANHCSLDCNEDSVAHALSVAMNNVFRAATSREDPAAEAQPQTTAMYSVPRMEVMTPLLRGKLIRAVSPPLGDPYPLVVIARERLQLDEQLVFFDNDLPETDFIDAASDQVVRYSGGGGQRPLAVSATGQTFARRTLSVAQRLAKFARTAPPELVDSVLGRGYNHTSAE
jgi:hypothetical protein